MSVRPRRDSCGYVPLDELLATLRVRLLRTLTHFDSPTAEDLNDALDIGEGDKRASNALATELRRLAAGGFVDRTVYQKRGGSGGSGAPFYRYAITEAGRAELCALLKRSELAPMPDDEGIEA